MVSASLPPGFRFHPTDVELVLYYLKRKLLGKPLRFKAIVEVDLYKFAPWDLPEKSCLRSRDLEWFFFCPRDRKYNSGPRTNRTTEIGYWKTTGKDRAICNESQTVGIKKTLVFHLGRAPLGSRTNWVMHEYKLEDKNLSDAGISLDAYVLCKIFEKSGAGPKNGEQHGAPFDEKDWEDGLEVDNSLAPLLIAETGSEVDNSQVPLLATDTASLPSHSVDDNQDISMAKSMLDLSNKGGFSVESPCREASCDISTHNLPLSEDLDLDSLLACFGEVDDLCGNNNFTQKSGRLHYSWQTGLDQGSPLQELQLLTSQNNVHGSVQNDRIDIYSGLEDIYPGAELKAVDTSHLPDMGGNNGLDQTLLGNGNYLELKDLDSSIEYPMRGPGSVRTEFENFGTRSELETIDKLCFPNSLVTGNNSSLMELNDFENLLKYPIVANMNDKMISGSQYGQYLYPRVANMNDKITSGSHYDQYLSADAVLPAFVLGSCSKRPKVSGVLNDNLLMSSYDNIGSGSDAACICENASQSSLTAGRKGELGETHMGEALMRGEQHSEYSRLECLLGSIPARSTSAAEYLSANGAKGYKGNSLVGYYSGSSTIVKAEVTDHCGCTNDALSGKLGEFPYLCCCGHRMCHEHKLLRMDAAAAACRSGFNLKFLISYMGSSHFVGVKLNWYTLKLIISS